MIKLQPMTEDDFKEYLDKALIKYANEKVKAGNWTESEALERSKKDYSDILPQGIYTPNQYFYTILNEENTKVGFIWFAVLANQPEWYFIYDFEVYEAFRRRGYATQALDELEIIARSHGITMIELHVFGSNTAARELYKKVGFVESNVMMTKKVTTNEHR